MKETIIVFSICAAFCLSCKTSKRNSDFSTVKDTSSDKGFWQSDGVAKIKIEAPNFDRLFRAERKSGDSVDATITVKGKSISATLVLRGHSSVRLCKFPKFKIVFNGPSDFGNGNPSFFDSNSPRVGTHCDPEMNVVSELIQRLSGEDSPWREELVYNIQRELRMKAPLTRIAEIEYPGSYGKHKAFIIEGWKDFRKRSNLKAYNVNTTKLTRKNLVEAQDEFATGHLFQILINNFDFRWDDIDYHSLITESEDPGEVDPWWNIKFVKKEEVIYPVFNDYDLAGVVKGKNLLSDSRGAEAERKQINELFRHFTYSHEFAFAKNAIEVFFQKFETIEQLIKKSKVDSLGVEALLKRLNLFYSSLAEIKLKVRPCIQASNEILERFKLGKSFQVNPPFPYSIQVIGREGNSIKLERHQWGESTIFNATLNFDSGMNTMSAVLEDEASIEAKWVCDRLVGKEGWDDYKMKFVMIPN